MPVCDTHNMSWQYIAGYLDGEGSILTKINNHGSKNWGCRVVLVNTNLESLEAIHRFLLENGINGKINEKPTQNSNDGCVRKRCWHWRVNKKCEVLYLLTQILPFLIIKREKAILAIEYMNIVKPRDVSYTSTTAYKTKLSESEKLAWLKRKQNVSNSR
jgi:hypothetical protein